MIQIGYFGKTIHRGDFVRFNLPRSFITVMDDWLQNVLILGESTYENDWPAVYTQWPDYRFHWSANIAGDGTWAGIISASSDKVGRRFPFCIAICLPEAAPPWWSQSELADSLCELSSVLKSTRQPDYDFEQLQTTLAEIADDLSASLELVSRDTLLLASPAEPDHFALLTSGNHLSQNHLTTASVLDVVLRQSYFNYSVWAPMGHNANAKGIITSGLPDVNTALSMFSMQWNTLSASELQSAIRVTSPVDSAQSIHNEELKEPSDAVQHASDASGTEEPDDADGELSSVVPQEEDWTALEVMETPVPPASRPVPRPRIEPLELEDDSTTKAPWD